MTQEDHIQDTQQANFAKVAHERDLFKENPELKTRKEALTADIHRTLDYIDTLEKVLKDLKKSVKEESVILEKAEELKQVYAGQAYNLQQCGIFWTDEIFSIKRPADPVIDQNAMFKSLTPEQQEKYIIRTTETVTREVTTINYVQLVKDVPLIYTITKPIIARKPQPKTKKTGDLDNE